MSPTAIRVIDGATVRRLLPFSDCLEVVRQAMIVTSERRVHLPLRQGMPIPNGVGALGMMPGYLGNPSCFGIKLVSLFPGNRARGLSTHLGLYVLYSADDGIPLAMMNAADLTAIRTAAASAVATLSLMRGDSHTLAILGTGEQARAHIDALLTAHAFTDVRIWGRDIHKAAALADECRAKHSCEFSFHTTTRSTVAPADVVCTVTSSEEPILGGEDLRPGMHINLVGSSFPNRREVDDAAVLRARYFVDYRESAYAQAGELLHAVEAGLTTRNHVEAEIGEVLNGTRPGRTTRDQITLYKSLGIASQDLAAAWHVYLAAKAENAGALVHL